MTERYNHQDGGPATQPDSGAVASEPVGERSATVGERATEPNLAGQGLGQISGAAGERADPVSRSEGEADSVETAGETVAVSMIGGPADTRPVGTDTLAHVGDADEKDASSAKK